MNITMDSITIESVKKATSCSFIDNDLALIDDISTVTMSNSARYMRCFIIVICSQGHLSYTVDTIQQSFYGFPLHSYASCVRVKSIRDARHTQFLPPTASKST